MGNFIIYNNTEFVKGVLSSYKSFLEVSRWLSTTQSLLAFLPEIFFFLANLCLFLYWFRRLKKFPTMTTFRGKQQYANKYSVERYMTSLIVISLITIGFLFIVPGFSMQFGGYIMSETLMFQFTYYTQMIKVFTLVLFVLFLYGSRLYFVKIFFPIIVNPILETVRIEYRFLEYFLLMTFGVGFTLLLISSSHLISLALTMEGLSFCLYILSGFQRTSRYAIEAAVKYFFYGAAVFGIFACGMLFIYIEIGGLSFYHIIHNSPTFYEVDPTVLFLGKESILYDSTKGSLFFMCGVFFIMAALIFKVGGAPFHFWVPDVYEGAPYPTTAFMASIGKVGFFAILIKLCAWVFVNNIMEWQMWFFVAGALSLIIGGLGALTQKRIKRFLAYSSIVHVGFLLLAIGVGDYTFLGSAFFYDSIDEQSFVTNSLISTLLYLGVYVLTVLFVFLILMNFVIKKTGKAPIYFTDFQGLLIHPQNKKKEFVFISIILVLLLLSMAGIPPFFGFFTKFYVLLLLVKYQLNLLVGLVVVFTVVGAFYYLRLLKIFFFEDKVVVYQTSVEKEETVALLRHYTSQTVPVGSYGLSYWFLSSFFIGFILFLTLICPWLGFDGVLLMLQKATLSLCWPELPLNLLATGFVNKMVPYLFPFDLQYSAYMLYEPAVSGFDDFKDVTIEEVLEGVAQHKKYRRYSSVEYIENTEQVIREDYFSLIEFYGYVRELPAGRVIEILFGGQQPRSK